MALKYGIMPAEVLGIDQETGLPIYDDRAVDEEYFARYHQELLNNGISAKIATSFQVLANGGRNLRIKPGAIFIEGYFAYDVEDCYITLDSSLNTLNRMDRIVARLDRAKRNIAIVVLKGNEVSVTPVAPSITRNDEVYDMVLAEVLVNGGSTEISSSNITDTRTNQSLCGIVSNVLGETDFTDFFAQYDAGFKEWFEHIKTQLSGDVAGNLQVQIDENADIATNKINELKDKFEERTEDTGWINLKLINGYITHQGSTEINPPRIRRIGNLVHIKGSISPPTNNNAGSGDGETFAIIPDGFIPTTSEYGIFQGTNTAIWLLRAKNTGELIAARYRTSWSEYKVPPNTAWMPFSITYTI